MVPIPREILESFTSRLDTTLHAAYEASRQTNAELEDRLAKAIRERDQARTEVDTLKEQQRRAAVALGLNRA